MPEYRSLSMPDPCPHVTRMDIIAAKLNGGDELDELMRHLAECQEKSWPR